jgi:hypothetical protein
MAVNLSFRVIYEFISSTTKKQAWDGQQVAYVIAADGKEDTIKAVLTNNNIARPGAVINIVNTHAAAGQSTNVLS